MKNVIDILGWGAIAVGLYFILSNFPIFSSGVADPKLGLAIIFFTGVLTSLHCVGMCSGFVISYAANNETNEITPHLCYNGSRILSYTILGAVLGLVGSVISINSQIRSYLAIFAGLFMIVFGLSMFFPSLRRFVSLPGLNLYESKDKKGPILIGLLNGLMPCGPLQAMLIYAAGTGSAIEGGLTMLVFGLGTVPLMLILGTMASLAVSNRVLIHKIVKFSGILVLVLGVIMLNRGFALSGIVIEVLSPFSAISSKATVGNSTALYGTDHPDGLGGSNGSKEYQEITMYVEKSGWNPSVLTVKKGIPVKWTIIVKELTGCNKGIKVPNLGIEHMFERNGEVVTFEFTANETGTIPFTCWMGMISGKIEVVE
jgi:sulfite exporter TauE/SafE